MNTKYLFVQGLENLWKRMVSLNECAQGIGVYLLRSKRNAKKYIKKYQTQFI